MSSRIHPFLAILTLAAALCLPFGGPIGLAADPATDKPAAMATTTTEVAIRAIRQHYAEINAKAAKCRRVKKELSGFSTEGGTLVAYFRGDALLKLELTFYGESGQASEEYYYTDGKLIFLYRADSDYTKLLSGKIARTVKSRLYFRDDTLIAWIDEPGQAPPPGSGEFQQKQKECLRDAKEFSQGARSPQPVIEATR